MTVTTTPAALDDETLSRALLTYCVDSADALMYATLKGADNASAVARQLIAIHNSGVGQGDLEVMFARGLVRWGRHLTASGTQAFRRALVRWLARMDTLPALTSDALVQYFTRQGALWLIAPHSPFWPGQLADLSIRKDWAPPLCLWGQGDITALTSCPHPVAIVGSRGADGYGCGVARSLAETAAASGHLVVSGGAIGTDAAAHWGALAAMRDSEDLGEPSSCGRTIAVFAGGLDHVGPRANDTLFARILECGGALISELSPETIAEPRRFLLRNRIIAALATTVVVTQARRRSGALNTANWAADLGREVYAAPGEITAPRNAGCNLLIRDNKATILCALHDITDICHQPHAARTAQTQAAPQNGTVPDAQAQEHDAARAAVLKAVRRCRSQHLSPTVDELLGALQADTSPAVESLNTPQGLMSTLGAMEMDGALCMHQGRIVLTPPANGAGRTPPPPHSTNTTPSLRP